MFLNDIDPSRNDIDLSRLQPVQKSDVFGIEYNGAPVMMKVSIGQSLLGLQKKSFFKRRPPPPVISVVLSKQLQEQMKSMEITLIQQILRGIALRRNRSRRNRWGTGFWDEFYRKYSQIVALIPASTQHEPSLYKITIVNDTFQNH